MRDSTRRHHRNLRPGMLVTSSMLCLLVAVPSFGQAGAAGTPNTTKTCKAPEFNLLGWQTHTRLVLTGTAATESGTRKFKISVCFGPVASPAPAPGQQETPLQDDITRCVLEIPTIPLSADSSSLTEIAVPFADVDWVTLLRVDGNLYVRYTSLGEDCKVQGQADNVAKVPVFDRHVAKIQGGTLYRLNDAGDWDTNSIEAATRFTTRWLSRLDGEAEFRYSGLKQSGTTTQPQGQNAGTTTTTNPFSASKGALEGDLSLGYYLAGRGVDTSILGVGGFGLTTLRGATTTTSSGSTSTPSDFAQAHLRLFAGFRALVPFFRVDGLDEVSKPHTRFQVTFARDDLWNFTMVNNKPVDKPNRLVFEGDFEFLQGGTNQAKVNADVHLRWDAPAGIRGTSDLRIAILGAVNLFKP